MAMPRLRFGQRPSISTPVAFNYGNHPGTPADIGGFNPNDGVVPSPELGTARLPRLSNQASIPSQLGARSLQRSRGEAQLNRYLQTADTIAGLRPTRTPHAALGMRNIGTYGSMGHPTFVPDPNRATRPELTSHQRALLQAQQGFRPESEGYSGSGRLPPGSPQEFQGVRGPQFGLMGQNGPSENFFSGPEVGDEGARFIDSAAAPGKVNIKITRTPTGGLALKGIRTDTGESAAYNPDADKNNLVRQKFLADHAERQQARHDAFLTRKASQGLISRDHPGLVAMRHRQAVLGIQRKNELDLHKKIHELEVAAITGEKVPWLAEGKDPAQVANALRGIVGGTPAPATGTAKKPFKGTSDPLTRATESAIGGVESAIDAGKTAVSPKKLREKAVEGQPPVMNDKQLKSKFQQNAPGVWTGALDTRMEKALTAQQVSQQKAAIDHLARLDPKEASRIASRMGEPGFDVHREVDAALHRIQGIPRSQFSDEEEYSTPVQNVDEIDPRTLRAAPQARRRPRLGFRSMV